MFLFEEDETTEGFIEIREADGGKVVTIIEFHSPTNKAGGVGTKKYLQKQSHVMQSETSLVEIDLIRGGRRVLAMSDAPIPAEWAEWSLALVRKGWEGRQFTLYHMPLRKRLSPLPIPLRFGEKPVVLDLQAIHDECYRKGRYDRINYAFPPEPRLSADDQTWSDQILVAAGKRYSGNIARHVGNVPPQFSSYFTFKPAKSAIERVNTPLDLKPLLV